MLSQLLLFLSNFLVLISSVVISLTVIFKVSISVSLDLVFGLDFFVSALKSSEDSNLPNFNFLVNYFLFLHISNSTDLPTAVSRN